MEKGSSSHKKSEGEMKRGVSLPIDIPNVHQRDDTFVPGSPRESSILHLSPPYADNVESLPLPSLNLGSRPSAHQDDFSGAEHTLGASEMEEEMQPDKDHGKTLWELINQEDAVYITMDMPGVTKETVKVRVESGFLVIKDTRENDPELQTSARISLMMFVILECKMSEMKAEMKNEVLMIKIPKVKEEERTDIVFDVQVD